MPFIQRYSDVKKGGIVFTGNTLGLSKAANQNAPGTEGSIGAFTSLNTALQVGTFPAGTTLDYTQNGSRGAESSCRFNCTLCGTGLGRIIPLLGQQYLCADK